uniref:Intraflagellar transport protein 122 homolog n=1 Tax=Brugia malayi TaxID=6279 RepID=A0A8L7T2X8_BRUMA
MRPILQWIDKVSEDDSETGCCVYDLAFKPDGSELLVAADMKVLIYDGSDGTLLQSLKGHKDLVYAVAFSYNGENFASGSADRSVIIWTEQHEGTLKYIHNEAIQCLAFSPATCFLLSCAISDFGIWTQLEKSVSKQRTSSRCLCCAWSCDGQLYAIGMFDGTVSLRSAANNAEIKKIERSSGEPVWAIAFGAARSTVDVLWQRDSNIQRSTFGELLVLVDWGQRAGFYDLEGNQLIREDKKLGYDPTAVEFFNYGQFLIICGSNRQVILYSREGTTLGTVAQMDTWVWTVKARPNTNAIVVGCVDGTLACYQLMFSTVHGLHKERYAYRENMTEVVVQHLANQTSVRIYCNDLIRKIAVYYNRLAVQLTDRVEIYRLIAERDDGQLEYRLVEEINRAFECSLLVICAHHIIVCQERRLQCYDHRGLKQREWLLESLIRYIKVIGGPPGREAILVGLRNGTVCKIFVDNPFITEILRLKSAVRCLDISHLRGKLAIVDETGICTTFDIKTKQLLFQEPSCNSVAWNADQENLLCYAGGGALCIKADSFSSHQQRMQGFVVGFSGKRVFCLHMFTMIAVEVPLSNQLYQYLEQKMYKEAFDLASLGVTESDWEVLGHDALHNFQFDIAQKAFHRIKDARYLQLIWEIKNMIKKETKKELMLGYIKAYEGRYREAATLFKKSGCEQETLEMFTDLRMFDQAQELLSSASGETQKALLRKRADWAQNSNEPIIAAEMFMASGDYERAVNLMIKNDWIDMLINLAHRIDRSNVDVLRIIGNYLAKKEEYTLASQLFQSINDIHALINMYVDAELWNDAFLVASKFQKYNEEVYLPYARWLAENDRFDEAQKAYHMAGHDMEALQVLEQLVGNAIRENRFIDAGYYNWMLSMQYLERYSENPELNEKFLDYSNRANCYYAFDIIHKYLAEPFTSCPADALINAARYLAFQKEIYKISRVCGISNPLVGTNECIHCKTPFILSFVSFEVLPLVEFFISDDINLKEARQLISVEPPLGQNKNPLQEQMNLKTGKVVADRETLLKLEKQQVIIAEWPAPFVTRFYYNIIPEISITQCTSCYRMFHADDFEMAYLKTGACPFCHVVPHKRTNYNFIDDNNVE